MYENILFEKKDGVAYLTLNRPDRLNALNGAVLKELDDALAAIGGDAEIRVLVVRGAGEKALAAGADITEMQSMEAEAGMAFGAFGQKVFARIEALRQPAIAMIPGFALGGGCELALACDIRIASEKARFGQPEVGLGITAGFGGTQRLARIVGVSNAMELILTAKTINAARAQELGLVSHVYPPEELMDKAMELAQAIHDSVGESCYESIEKVAKTCDKETKKEVLAHRGEAMYRFVAPFDPVGIMSFGSTDVGDVSWYMWPHGRQERRAIPGRWSPRARAAWPIRD